MFCNLIEIYTDFL